jgi:hypothetical protein
MSIILTDINPIVAYPSIKIHCTCEQTMSPSSHKLPAQCPSISHPKIQRNTKYFTDVLIVAVKTNQKGLKLSGSQYQLKVYTNEVIYCVKTCYKDRQKHYW